MPLSAPVRFSGAAKLFSPAFSHCLRPQAVYGAEFQPYQAGFDPWMANDSRFSRMHWDARCDYVRELLVLMPEFATLKLPVQTGSFDSCSEVAPVGCFHGTLAGMRTRRGDFRTAPD
jgi:hypothetical protein